MDKNHHTLGDPSSLVTAARNGDEDAFGILAARHWPTVHAIAYATVRDPDMADDIAQEAFLVAWTHLAKLHKPESFLMWLRKITRNLGRNAIRSSVYRRQLRERYAAQSAAHTDSDTPEARAATEERNAELDDALQRLSPRVREVVSLYYLHERSAPEIARALDISTSAVKKRLERGRRELRSTLETGWKRDRQSAPADAEAMVQNIMSALAIGPAVPAIGQSASGAGASLLFDHLSHSGAAALKPLITGGMIMSAKQATILAVLSIGIGFAGYLAMTAKTDDPGSVAQSAPSIVSTPSASPLESGPTIIESEAPETVQGKSSTPAPTEPPSQLDSLSIGSGVSGIRDEALKAPPSVDPASIEGYVVNQWGEPVPDATVTVVSASRIQSGTGRRDRFSYVRKWPARKHHYAAISQADGTFEIRQITRVGQTAIFASTPEATGTASATLLEGQDIKNLKVVVREGFPLWGRLITAGRKPISGAVIDTVAYVAGMSGRGGSFGYEVTDEDGSFRILYEKAGMATLRAVQSNGDEQIFPDVPIDAGEVIDFIVNDAAMLSGTIDFANGGSPAGLEIILFSTITMSSDLANGAGASVTTMGSVYSTSLQSDGEYSIANIATPADYRILIRTDTGTELTQPIVFPTFEPGEQRRWDYTIEGGLTVLGTVLSSRNGAPLPAEVYALRDGVRVGTGFAITQRDGSFALQLPAEPGHYTIAPTHRFVPVQHRSRQHDIQVDLALGDDPNLNLQLDDPYTIHLRVVDVNAEPVPDAAVSANWEIDNAAWGVGELSLTDAEGRFTWTGFAPIGAYKLLIVAADYLTSYTPPYEGSSGDSFGEDTITLYEPSSVEATILDPSGEPLRYGTLRLRAAVDGVRHSSRSISTDGNGYFRADNIPAAMVIIELERNPNVFYSGDPIPDTLDEERDRIILSWLSSPTQFVHDHVVDLGEITLMPD